MNRLNSNSARGFLIVDVLIAMGLLVIAAVILVSATSRTRRASDSMSDSRHAGRVAEETLIDLESGLTPPAADAATKISIEPSEGGAAVPGKRWVQVVVTYQGQSRLLIGLVPQSAQLAPAGGGR